MVVTIGGAPNIEWVGPGMLPHSPQCPGQSPTEDLGGMSPDVRGDLHQVFVPCEGSVPGGPSTLPMRKAARRVLPGTCPPNDRTQAPLPACTSATRPALAPCPMSTLSGRALSRLTKGIDSIKRSAHVARSQLSRMAGTAKHSRELEGKTQWLPPKPDELSPRTVTVIGRSREDT